MDYKISTIDQQRFGAKTAKANLNGTDNVQLLIDKSNHDNVSFLIVRVSTDDLHIIQELEQYGFFLTDTLIYYLKKNRQLSINPSRGILYAPGCKTRCLQNRKKLLLRLFKIIKGTTTQTQNFKRKTVT